MRWWFRRTERRPYDETTVVMVARRVQTVREEDLEVWEPLQKNVSQSRRVRILYIHYLATRRVHDNDK